jgi:hypothetical protein
MLGPTAGDTYLAFIGLPDEYPGAGDLARELDDEIAMAAALVVQDWKGRDPLLRAMLDERCELNRWERYKLGELPVGTNIRYERTGWCPSTWWGRTGRAGVDWSDWLGDTRNRPIVDGGTEVDAWVPVPFDLAPLLGEPHQ